MKSVSPSKIVRNQARQTLKGHYVAAVASTFVLLLPVYLLIGITYIANGILLLLTKDMFLIGVLKIVILTPLNIVIAVLLSPLFNGFVRVFWQASLNGEFRFDAMFYYFEKGKYQKTLLLNLSFLIRIMLPALLFFLPLFLYYLFCFGLMPEFVGSVLYKDFAFITAVMCSILLILYSLKYFLVFTMYCADDDADVKGLFRESKSVMAEQKHSAAQLIFSFTPWLLLCLLILPALYVIPYMTQSLCIGAKWMTLKGK